MNTLPEILSSKVRAEIFRLLFGLNQKELHVRELERQTERAIPTIRQELKKLARLDLVRARRDGNRLYYQANVQHPLYTEIRSMVLKTSGLIEVLRDVLDNDHIRTAFVFGSIARGEAGAESDVDIMVIGDVGLRKITGMLSGIAESIGREVNPHVMTMKEFKKRKEAGEHFLKRVMKSPKLFIHGNEDDLKAMGE
jgi:predicted nucleotidyltransferase